MGQSGTPGILGLSEGLGPPLKRYELESDSYYFPESADGEWVKFEDAAAAIDAAVAADRERCRVAFEALKKESHGWNSFSYTVAVNDCIDACCRPNVEAQAGPTVPRWTSPGAQG